MSAASTMVTNLSDTARPEIDRVHLVDRSAPTVVPEIASGAVPCDLLLDVSNSQDHTVIRDNASGSN